MTAVTVLFWVAAAVVVYATVGYPLLLRALTARRQAPAAPAAGPDAALPRVAVLVAAHDEERHIGERIRNLLALDYPQEKLRICVGSDGSTDRTVPILRAAADPRVHVADYAQRRGKASVVNDLAALADEEILVFTDANTAFEADTLRRLVRHFTREDVGCVCGELRLAGTTGDNQDPAYWRFERMLKEREARIGALLGVNGGVYAMRRSAYRPIPPDTIVDDFWISMQVIESGLRCVYDHEAVAREDVPERIADEFRRRVRIGTGDYQALVRFRGLLHPRHGAVAFTFFSHKVLRWLTPHAMVVALLTNIALAGRPLYALLLAGQAAFYGGALVAWLASRRRLAPRLLRPALFFVSMNLALLVGWWRWLRGGAAGTWARTAR